MDVGEICASQDSDTPDIPALVSGNKYCVMESFFNLLKDGVEVESSSFAECHSQLDRVVLRWNPPCRNRLDTCHPIICTKERGANICIYQVENGRVEALERGGRGAG